MIETNGEGKSAVGTPDGKSRTKKKTIMTIIVIVIIIITIIIIISMTVTTTMVVTMLMQMTMTMMIYRPIQEQHGKTMAYVNTYTILFILRNVLAQKYASRPFSMLLLL